MSHGGRSLHRVSSESRFVGPGSGGQESGPEAENQPKGEQDLARKVDYVLDHVYLWVGSVAQADPERRGSAR